MRQLDQSRWLEKDDTAERQLTTSSKHSVDDCSVIDVQLLVSGSAAEPQVQESPLRSPSKRLACLHADGPQPKAKYQRMGQKRRVVNVPHPHRMPEKALIGQLSALKYTDVVE